MTSNTRAANLPALDEHRRHELGNALEATLVELETFLAVPTLTLYAELGATRDAGRVRSRLRERSPDRVMPRGYGP